ncbi:MAG: PAS domain S-box protein [Desulfobacterales bacterium]|nr:PAS domain S-box protein [Desulfobacterales bacterium]
MKLQSQLTCNNTNEFGVNLQQEEYRNLFDLVPCIISVQDKNYRLIHYNNEFAKLFGAKPGDFCFYAYKDRTEKCVECPVEKTFQDGLSHYSEERSLKDGKLTHWVVKTAPIKNAQGEIIAAMEMSLDITKSKLLENKLETIEKKYHAIFKNMPSPVFVLDQETLTILDCNNSATLVYEYAKEEIIGMCFTDLFKEYSPEILNHIRTTLDIHQVRHITKNKKTVFVNIKVSPLDYPNKRMLLAITSDITKKLETEQQLIQASKMATLGEMATGVAHELNQPLTVIKTASSFLMKKIKKNELINPENLFVMVSEIDSHVDRASKIINHMRQFGRKSEMTLEKIQINAILKKTFEFFSQQLRLREIELVWDIDENLPMILSDASRLEQVFINLFINARDAIEEKSVSTGQKCDKKITLHTRHDADQVMIQVRDTGIGIPEPLLEKIFEPFFTTKKVGQGTGLGLSISYGIIKDCGGNISAVSEQGKGSTFIITLPIPDK